MIFIKQEKIKFIEISFKVMLRLELIIRRELIVNLQDFTLNLS